ncbi:THAP domain-containing protein 1, partial [Armadillidium vulgare]
IIGLNLVSRIIVQLVIYLKNLILSECIIHLSSVELCFIIFLLTNKKLTKIWVMKMKRGKFYPSKFSKICSDHFTPDCINPGVGFGKPTLK